MILVAATAYNEIKYIKHFVDFYHNQNCEILVLDNYSTDGTYEWLKDNKIHTGLVNTQETFHLIKLQTALVNHINKMKPSWIIYTGIDLFYYFSGTIKNEIKKAVLRGCDVIEVTHLDAYNTGEKFTLPFQNNYFYVKEYIRPLRMISRWYQGFRFAGDGIKLPRSPLVYRSNGFLINYGMCKSREEREETYQRRIKAWEIGELRGHGTHYKPAHDRQWIWRKEELVDIRETRYYSLMK